MPKGGTGTDEETWRAGPGGLSVIEEYHSTGAEGGLSGLGAFWPDKQRPTMRVLWRDSDSERLRQGEGRRQMGRKPSGDYRRVRRGRKKDDVQGSIF